MRKAIRYSNIRAVRKLSLGLELPAYGQTRALDKLVDAHELFKSNPRVEERPVRILASWTAMLTITRVK